MGIRFLDEQTNGLVAKSGTKFRYLDPVQDASGMVTTAVPKQSSSTPELETSVTKMTGRNMARVPQAAARGLTKGSMSIAGTLGVGTWEKKADDELAIIDGQIRRTQKELDIVNRQIAAGQSTEEPSTGKIFLEGFKDMFTGGETDEFGQKKTAASRWQEAERQRQQTPTSPEDLARVEKLQGELTEMMEARKNIITSREQWKNVRETIAAKSQQGWLKTPKDQMFLEYIAEVGGQALPSLAAALGASALTGSPTVGAMLLGNVQGLDAYFDARKEGLSQAEAGRVYFLETVLSTAVEKLPLDVIQGMKGPGVLRFIASGASEGLEEVVDTVKSNLIKKGIYNENQAAFEGWKEALIGGAIAGGLASTAFNEGNQVEVTDQITGMKAEQPAPGDVKYEDRVPGQPLTAVEEPTTQVEETPTEVGPPEMSEKPTEQPETTESPVEPSGSEGVSEVAEAEKTAPESSSVTDEAEKAVPQEVTQQDKKSESTRRERPVQNLAREFVKERGGIAPNVGPDGKIAEKEEYMAIPKQHRSRQGQPVDEVLEEARNEGIIPEDGTLTDLVEALTTKDARISMSAEEEYYVDQVRGEQEKKAKEREFLRNSETVDQSDLGVGDKFVRMDSEFEITEEGDMGLTAVDSLGKEIFIPYEDGSVQIEPGSLQKAEAGPEVVEIEEGMQQARSLGNGMWEVDDGTGPPIELDENNPDDMDILGPLIAKVRQKEVQTDIDEMRSEFADDMEIEAVPTIDDLPEGSRRKAKNASAKGNVRAMYDTKTGKIYVVAEGVADKEAVRRAVFHEAVGHKGLRGTLGNKLNDVLSEVYVGSEKAELERIADLYDLDLNTEQGQLTAAEELIAEASENRAKNPTLWEKVKKAFRKTLINIGFKEATIDDYIESLLDRAEAFTKSNNAVEQFQSEEHPRFAVDYKEWEQGLRPELRGIVPGELEFKRTDDGYRYETTTRKLDGKEKQVLFIGKKLFDVYDSVEDLEADVKDYYERSAKRTLAHARRQPWYQRAKAKGLSDIDLFGYDPATANVLKAEVSSTESELPSGEVETRFSIADRATQPGKFPDSLSNVVKSTRFLKRHAEWKPAKKGDVKSAKTLVDRVLKQSAIDELSKLIPKDKSVNFVPVIHKDPGPESNAIPIVYAIKLSDKFNGIVYDKIGKLYGKANTDASVSDRSKNQQSFAGKVIPGELYVVVDDTMTSGDTLVSLIDHIEKNGGTVIAATTLADTMSGNRLKPRPQDVQKLLDKMGLNEAGFEHEIGIPITQLTGNEIYRFANLTKAKSIEEFRTRIASVIGKKTNQRSTSSLLNGSEQNVDLRFSVTPDQRKQEALRKLAERRKQVQHKFSKRVSKDARISPEIRKSVENHLHSVRAMDYTIKEAMKVLDDKGVDASTEFFNDKSTLHPATRIALGMGLVQAENELALNQKDKINRSFHQERALEIMDKLDDLGLTHGRAIQIFSGWGNTLATPESAQRYLQKTFRRMREQTLNKKKPMIDKVKNEVDRVNAESIDEALLDEKVTERVNKILRDMAATAKKRFDVRFRNRKRWANEVESFIAETDADEDVRWAKSMSMEDKFQRTAKQGAKFIFEMGNPSMDEWSEAMINKYGERVAPHLEDIYARSVLIADNVLSRGKRPGRKPSPQTVAKRHFREPGDTTLVEKLVDQVGISEADAQEFAKALEAKMAEDTAKKKRKAIRKILKAGQAKRKDWRAIDQIIELSNKGALDDDTYLNEFADAFDLPKMTPEMMEKVGKMAKEIGKTPEGFQRQDKLIDMMAYIKQQQGIRIADVGWSLWYANLLSGPQTHARNVNSTLANTVDDLVTAGFASPKNVPFMIRAIPTGFAAGIREAGAMMKAGKTLLKGNQKLSDATSSLEMMDLKGIKKVFGAWKYVTRAMLAEDVVFYKTAQEARAIMVAADMARAKNLRGRELWAEVRKTMGYTSEQQSQFEEQAKGEGLGGIDARRRVKELKEQGWSPEMMESADDFAARATFNYQPEGYLGVMADGLARLGQKVPPVRVIIPFTRIVANVANISIDHTPWGFIRAEYGLKQIDGTRRKPENLEYRQRMLKALFGTAAMSLSYYMDWVDRDKENPRFRLHGRGPSDYKDRYQMRESGWKPYSVQIGDKCFSYLLTPMAIPFSIIGNMRDAERYDEMDKKDILTRTVFAVKQSTRTIFDMSFFSGVSDLFDMLGDENINYSNRKFQRFFARQATTATIPFSNMAKQIWRYYDPTVRDANTMVEYVLRDTPIASARLKPRLNALGEPAKFDTALVFSKRKNDPVWNLIATKQAFISAPTAAQVRMSQEDHYRYIQESGKIIRREIMANISSLRRASRKQAQEQIAEIVSNAREQVRKEIDRGY